MTISKVKSFLTSIDRKDPPPKKPMDFIAGSENQAANAEQLMRQLRDIILAPSAQVTELRFTDMLNNFEEQKKNAERRFEKVDRHLAEAADRATIMTVNLEEHDEDIKALRQHVEGELMAMRAEQKSVMAELRTVLDQSSRAFFEEMTKRSQEFEIAIRNEVLNLSSSLVVHVSEEDKRWEEERQNSTEMLESLIAQWRAERENNRRQDMENLAGSMMDMGRRLMTAQPHA
jgi:hypothetical protein